MIHAHNEHATQTCGSYISEELKAYIVQRHGTLELDPLPSSSPQDPLNWPLWMKNMNMLMVAFHTMMATFSAAAIIPASSVFAEKYGISLHQASYLTSVQVSPPQYITRLILTTPDPHNGYLPPNLVTHRCPLRPQTHIRRLRPRRLHLQHRRLLLPHLRYPNGDPYPQHNLHLPSPWYR